MKHRLFTIGGLSKLTGVHVRCLRYLSYLWVYVSISFSTLGDSVPALGTAAPVSGTAFPLWEFLKFSTCGPLLFWKEDFGNRFCALHFDFHDRTEPLFFSFYPYVQQRAEKKKKP